jgi:AAA15 family ATPase/GTPase
MLPTIHITEITELHEQVFLFLKEKRRINPELCFSLRSRTDGKLRKGYWFSGGEQSLYFSFWTGADFISKAHRISLNINLEGELNVFLNARDSEDYAKVFDLMTKIIGGFSNYNRRGIVENQWLKRYENNEGANWRNHLDDFIKKDLELITNTLKLTEGSIANVTERIKRINFKKDSYGIHHISVIREREKLLAEMQAERQAKKLQQEQTERDAQEQERIRHEIERKKVKTLRLTTISLENIKHFSKLTVNLTKRVIVLIGENGSGKSTVLQAIALGLTGVDSFRDDDDNRKNVLKDEKLTEWLQMTNTKGNDATYANKGNILLTYTIDNEEFSNKINWQKEPKRKFAEVENDYEKGNFRTFVERSIDKAAKKIADTTTEDQIDTIKFKKQDHLVNLVIALPQGGEQNTDDLFNDDFFPDPYDLLPIIKNEVVDKLHKLQKWIELYDFWYKERENGYEVKLQAIQHLFTIISKITADNNTDYQPVEFVRVFQKDELSPKRVVINKANSPDGIYLDLLSQGYKNLFYWVGSIISSLYRFKDYCQTQPYEYSEYAKLTVTEIPAIVLIDEIDTYLHPKWQRNILKVLIAEFPKLQFVVTTHSPTVLSYLENKGDAGFYFISPEISEPELNLNFYGRRVSEILYDYQDIEDRPTEIREEITELLFLAKTPQDVRFKPLLEKLTNLLGENDGVIRQVNRMIANS